MGAITFGFLQRAGSLYGTGIDRNCRVIGATAQTASGLNSILGKHFVLAQADETFIKLTDMTSPESIQASLEGYDAVIVGSSYAVEPRPVTPGTFETTPNSKTLELYWDTVRGKEATAESKDLAQSLIDNTLEACKNAGIQHVVAVDTTPDDSKFMEKVQSCGVPYSLIQCPSTLANCKDYTYKKGLQENLSLSSINNNGAAAGTSSSATTTVYREDLAALCVQCLQSLEWGTSRTLSVQSNGGPLIVNEPTDKRPDQQWCFNQHVLAGKLTAFQ